MTPSLAGFAQTIHLQHPHPRGILCARRHVVTRSLAPKEHGAYGQLFVPLATGLCLSRPTVGTSLLALSFGSAFFAHEPALILLGHRGPRARAESGDRAKIRLYELLAISVAAGITGFAFLGARVFWPIALVASLGTLAFLLAYLRRERTLAGELTAAAALCATMFPIAVGLGRPIFPACMLTLSWIISFFATTAAVRRVVARHKRRPNEPAGVVVLLLSTGAAAACSVGGAFLSLVSCIPMLGLAWVVFFFPPHPRHLMRVGWGLAASSVVQGALLLTFS